jgi:hypothetical protein
LAGEAATDDINGNSISEKSVGCEFADVFIYWHLWPVFCQYAAWERFDLAKCDCLAEAGTFQAKAKTANPAEQVKQF